MWYLTIQRWAVDRKQAISELRKEHLRLGIVLMAGPAEDFESGIVVLRGEDRAGAERICRTDPYVAAGYREFDLVAWDVHQSFGVNASPRHLAP